ncbi:MAG: hypothetical protein KF764_27470 [Labilithrix sp.]|nr:hypothetical protein [Labilithrix sp.]
MVTGQLGRFAFILGLAVSAGAAGCFLADEETEDSRGEVVGAGDTSAVLRSTLILDTGCTAAKVGPRHLLTAARCVVGKPELAPGKTITFKAASQLRTIVADDEAPVLEADDAGAADDEADETEADGGAADETEADAAAPKKTNASDREATIEEIEVHPSFTAKCQDDLCAFGAIGASDAKDIAVIILDADLETVPTIPIDLDTVGQSDTLLAVGSGCATFDGEATGVKTYKTMAVPPKTVNHPGSPYIEDPALVTRLGAGYVVTPGFGWRAGEPRICKTDIGAPLFRGGQAAVSGVTSNFTTFGQADEIAPVTLHHAKVDTASKVGTWLATLGVETTHSCSEMTGGCVKKGYDGGVPGTQAAPKTDDGTEGGDAGELVDPPGDDEDDAGPVSTDLPDQGEEAPLPESSEDEYQRENTNDYDDWDAGPKKKKKKKASGCSAAPGSMPAGSDGIVLVVGLALAGAVARRRRAG